MGTSDGAIYLSKSRAGSRFAIVGMQLQRLVYKASDEEPLQALSHRVELIRLLSSVTLTKFSLRYVVAEPGQLKVVLLVRLEDAGGHLEEKARHALQALQSFLKVNFKGHKFAPLCEPASFRDVMAPFTVEDVVEISRHAAWLSTATWDVAYKPPREPLGFSKNRVRDTVSCGTSVQLAEKSPTTAPRDTAKSTDSQKDNHFLYVFPFLPVRNSLRQLCEHLMLQREPCIIDISYTPLTEGPQRQGILEALERSMSQCEEYLRGVYAHEQRTVLSVRTDILRKSFFAQKHLLESPGNAFFVHIRLVSPNQVDPGLVVTTGNALTTPLVASATSPPYLAGGFDTYRRSPNDVLRKALGELAPECEEDEPLRYCFDADSGSNVLVLPAAEGEDFPGIPVDPALFLGGPQGLPRNGTFMGETRVWEQKVPVRVTLDDHRRHVYMVGQTGVGKTSMILGMAMEHVRNGQGLAVLDPHGDLIDHVLARIPKGRLDDVILLDPGDTDYPVGLNLLEWQTEDQKSFLIDEIVSMFRLLYREEIVGPIFFHNVRYGLLLLMANRDDPGTLVEFPHLFSDKDFHRRWLPHVKDSLAVRFWTREYPKIDYARDDVLQYIVSKFDPFISHPLMRNIIGQRRSTINVEAVMNESKILLVNLSKGKLGELNSSMLGMIIIAKLYSAAMRRINMPMAQRRDFFVYVDEFQSLATDTFAHILSEARKFRLNLTLCNQYVAQLPVNIINGIFGNVGTLVVFRVGMQDAKVLAGYFEPSLTPYALAGQPNYHAYIRLLIDGRLTLPFSIQTRLEPAPSEREAERRSQMVRRRTRQRYGRQRAEIEEEIAKSLK